MKRFILTWCAGLLAAAMASPSFAADLARPIYKAPPRPTSRRSAGPASMSVSTAATAGARPTGLSSTGLSTGDFDVKGALVGVTLGYNLQTGNWVWGVEGDSTPAGSRAPRPSSAAPPAAKRATTGWRPGAAASAMPGIASCPTSPAASPFGDIKMTRRPGPRKPTPRSAGRRAPGSNGPSPAPGRPSSNISMPISARRPATPHLRHRTMMSRFKLNLIRAGINYRF